MANEVAKPSPVPAATAQQTLKQLMLSPAIQSQIATALPKHLTVDRFARVALTAMLKTPGLLKCDTSSFMQCILSLAQMGLEPDGRLAHLIPFENRKAGRTDCTLIVDYKGYVELVMRSGTVSNIHADVVCENDEFEYDRGELKKHKVEFRKPRGKVYAVYCLVRFKDGTEKCEVMSVEDVEAIRSRSRAGQSGPWVTDFREMAKKGLALDTPIPTPSGWTTMGEIQVGDEVFDMHGQQTRVMATSEVKRLPCFRVTFSNGAQLVCDDEHRWVATIGANGASMRSDGWPVYTVNELFAAKGQGKIVSVPVAPPLDCDWRELPIDPWSIGYWLGNGRRADGNVTCHAADRDEVVVRLESAGYTLGAVRKDSRAQACSVGIKGLRVRLRESGLLDNKHIPVEYLRGTQGQRESLLCGLMDSDGCVEKRRGRAIFSSTDKALAEQVLELAASLGQVAFLGSRMQRGYGKEVMCHTVQWQPSFCPVTLARKAANYRPRKIAPYRGISTIEEIESVPTRCIAVESESKTYLAGRSMIPTHNTVFKRLSKWLSMSPEIRDAMTADDEDHINAIETTTVQRVEQVAAKSRTEQLLGKLADTPTVGDDSPPSEPEEPTRPPTMLERFQSRVEAATSQDDLNSLAGDIDMQLTAGMLTKDENAVLQEALIAKMKVIG